MAPAETFDDIPYWAIRRIPIGVEVVYTSGEAPKARHDLSDPRYESWRTALGSVQGIYVITDTDSGKLYVGIADGAERIFGRWSQYAKDGHGGNKGLLELVGLDPNQAKHYAFSILRVFGPTVPTPEVDAAEEHYKNALQTKKPFGLNHN